MEFSWSFGKGIEKMDLTVQKAKNGDKEAFADLIGENKLILYKVAKKILNNDEDVKDAIQETIVKAYNSIINLKKNEYFRTWLIKILINECNSMLRQKKRIVYLEGMQEDETYKETFMHDTITYEVDSLEQDLKLVVILYYYEGFSVREISKILEVPEGTVKSRLSRARSKLFTMVKEGGIINE